MGRGYGFPHDRRTLTPLATSGLTTVEEINQAFREKNSALIRVGLARFSPEQRERIESLARDYVELSQAAVEVASEDLKQEPPELRLYSAAGLQDADVAEARARVEAKTAELEGMPMIFELVMEARLWLR